jgi:glucose/arabinose dehydrogenase
MTKNILDVISSTVSETISFGNSMIKEKMTELKQVVASQKLKPSSNFPMIRLAEGFEIEKVVEGLTYPTSVAWDDQGRMYVAEAGGTFEDEEDAQARILRVENGQVIEVVNLNGKIYPAISGMTWHNGAFYITHREMDLSGAVSKVTLDGDVTQLIGGIIDSKSDHQPNDIRVGKDGKMYVCVGIAGNSGFMDHNVMASVKRSPDGHPTVAKDIVLTGVNVEIPNYLEDSPGLILTGAFVPFGTETKPGQVIKGRNKCGGSILVFDPDDAEATVKPYAWGFRNTIGIAWNKAGDMFVAINGYDNAPARPIKDVYDGTYRVKEGAWYGWPDFTANFDPVTDEKYRPVRSAIAPVYIDGKRQERKIYFLIDHEASGLKQPDKSLILGLHEVNSSPSKPDIAPQSWGEYADHLFVPEFGDFEWLTNPTRDKFAGARISIINTNGYGQQDVKPFIQNKEPAPASNLGKHGEGIERPYDVKFGPDGAMYIVDFCSLRVNLDRIAQGKEHFPVEFQPRTGIIWKVTKTSERVH